MNQTDTVMVAGINGFVGHHVAHALNSRDLRMVGIGSGDLVAEDLRNVVDDYIQCDLSDSLATKKLDFSTARAIINLAGLANVGASFDNEEEYLRINRLVHINVCEAVRLSNNPSVRIVAVSTGAVYDSAQPMPLSEDSLVITAGSPYALSKLAMEKELKPYQDGGMDIVVVRPFNHTGPGQGPGFLVPDLLSQLQSIDSINLKILVGNLKTRRDYTDVRDIAEAYCALALAPKDTLSSKLYNICSGRSTSGEEILNLLLNNLGLVNKVKVEVDQDRIRPNDPVDIYGNHELLTKDTGWQPKIEIEKTLFDFIKSSR